MAQKCLSWGWMAPVDSAVLVIALFRCWDRQRSCGREPMPAMMKMVEGYAYDLTLVPICDSFFALTESCVGRPLQSGPLFALTDGLKDGYRDDELGLLAMLRESAAISASATSSAIPHGLPGALCWAAKALARVLGVVGMSEVTDQVRHCPFTPANDHGAAVTQSAQFRVV